MRTPKRSYLAVAGLAALALAASACGSSSTPTGGGGTGPGSSVSLNNGLQALNPGGTPKAGGTLNLLGVGDVDYMDYNISYYTVGYLGARMWVRGLYAYPATPGKTTVPEPDLATGPAVVSDNGLKYAITIKTGAKWDSTPARQVTAADAVRGLKRACNPVQPFGGLPDFESLIKGYAQFCAGFKATSVAGIKSYINSHDVSGISASGQTITYTLTEPASYFADMLTLPPFNPAPVESLNYLPASAVSYQHTVADGPYKVQSYTPTKKIVFVRNPAWSASTDTIRKAYVDTMNITETGDPTTIQQELQTNTAAGSMEFDASVPVGAVPGLVAKLQAGATKNFNLGPQFALNPYLVFNAMSPNSGGALGKTAVRQALSYGINRAHLVQDNNGAIVSPAATHILPTGINGSQNLPANYNPYPYNPTKAKSMLKAAGFPNGMTVKMLYRPASTASTKMFQTLQADLGKIGVTVKGVGVPDADFYVKYLEVPTVAKRGVWDLALSGWGPDWYGDAATSFFKPLFSGPSSYPPVGSNFGFYNNPAVTSLINKAASQANATTAAQLWGQLDQQVMKDAPIYPIVQPLWPAYHATYVHNAVYVPALQNFDPTNVWLSAPTG
jgi:peptide/nickel transport system substrate-binding protein